MVLATALLGSTLNQFFNRSEKLIQIGQKAGNNLLVEAAQRTRVIVQNLESAYSRNLDETIAKVDTTAQIRLGQIEDLLTQLESGGNQLIDHLTDNGSQLVQQIQQIANTAVLGQTQPQVLFFSPPFVIDQKSTMFSSTGNFYDSGKEGMTPTLVFGKNTFQPAQNTTQRLDFIINPHDIFPPSAFQDPKQIHYAEGKLQVPYTWLMSPKESAFKVLLGLLPATAGKITLIWSENKKTIETKTFISQTMVLKHNRLAAINMPLDFTPDPGWKVKTGHSHVNVLVLKNAFSPALRSDTAEKVTYLVRLRKNADVQFNVQFPMYREVDEIENSSQAFSLNWGESTFFYPPKEPWKIIFEAFNGGKYELSENHLSTPFLKLRKEGSRYKMSLIGTESPILSKL